VVRNPTRRLILLVAGLAVLAAVIAWAGVGPVRHALSQAWPFVPLLLLLEGARLPLETITTRHLMGAAARRLPLGVQLRAQAVFYAVATVLPGGRLAGEVSKAAILAPHVGRLRAVAVAAASQATSLIADACIALLALGVGITVLGPSVATVTLAGFALACTAFAVLVVLAPRSALPERLLARFPRVLRSAIGYRRAARMQPMVVPRAVLYLVVARVFQIALLSVALFAVGAGLSPAVGTMALAVNMMASAAADAVPGQLGPTDAALALFAPALGVATASMVSVSVIFHAVQLAWAAAFGAVGLLVPRAGGPAARSAERHFPAGAGDGAPTVPTRWSR
jgi:hypothetical protein